MTTPHYVEPTPVQMKAILDRMKQGPFRRHDIAMALEAVNAFTPFLMARSMIAKLYRQKKIRLQNGSYIWRNHEEKS